MGRLLSSGILGRPGFAGSDIDVTRLVVMRPDTMDNLRAGEIDQLDPDADILRLSASGTPRSLYRYSGSNSMNGPLRVGDVAAAGGGFMLDVVGAIRASGGIESVVLQRQMANTEGTPLVAGEFVQAVGGGPNRVQRAIATALATADVLGAAGAAIGAGATGPISYLGFVSAQLVTGLAVAEGDRIYLSAATAGAGTNVPPGVVGQVVAELGYVVDASTYTGTLPSNSFVTMVFDRKSPVVI